MNGSFIRIDNSDLMLKVDGRKIGNFDEIEPGITFQ
jgi:hypothetical protein